MGIKPASVVQIYGVEYSHLTSKWYATFNVGWDPTGKSDAEDMQNVCNSDGSLRLFSRKSDATRFCEAAIRRQHLRAGHRIHTV